jgi:putative ABC transport system permease protein
VTAIPTDTTMLTRPELREGRWLEPRETGAIVLNQVTLANTNADIQPGDTVELSIAGRLTTETTAWRVVGIAEERSATSGAYVTAEGLAKAMGEPVWSNTLRIHLEPILVILLATALPMGVIGGIGLASTMGANVLERTREFGVMHAIGAHPKAVRRIVVAEGVFIALASCLLAIVPALGLTAAMGALLGNTFMYAALPFRISILAAVVWTVLVVLGAWLATDAAATRASRLTVREALAYL